MHASIYLSTERIAVINENQYLLNKLFFQNCIRFAVKVLQSKRGFLVLYELGSFSNILLPSNIQFYP